MMHSSSLPACRGERSSANFRRSCSLVLIWLSATAAWAAEPRAKFNKVLTFGDSAPVWTDLPGVDGKSHSLSDYAEAQVLVVVFTCNHCPVAKAYEPRMLKFVETYRDRGVQWVAINVNLNKADRLDKMQERAKARGYTFPYLFDESQASARKYGATVTPHLFVLDRERRVAYMGAFDDSFDPAKVKRTYLTDAVDALLAGKPPPVRETLQRGCEIQYENVAKPTDPLE